MGIEVSEKDLDTIRKNIENDKLELQIGSATNLRFDENSFDTIVSWEVIEHIPRGHEKAMLTEVSRVLKPGGVFYLSTPHRSLFANILDPAWWFGHRHYTKEQLKRYAQGTRLEIESVKIKGGWWSLFFILNMYVSKWILVRKPIMENFFSGKEHVEYMKDEGFANLFIKFRKSQ